MITEIAIIGDRFMLSEMFESALHDACGDRVRCRRLDLPWPDQPMEHGYAAPGLDGLKEYIGDPGEVMAHVGQVPVLVTHLAPLAATMLARMPALRLVAVSRGGPVNIDMSAVRAAGVTVVNTPGRNASAVAEFTIGAILAETCNITRGHDALREGVYRGDLYRADVTGDELSDMTVGMIGAEALAAMRPGAILVNTARGPLVDYDALTETLRAGRIRGAMLETFAIEPVPPDPPLLKLPNVTLTPHIAGASLKTVRNSAGKAAEEVRRWLDGEPPRNPC